MVKKKGADEKMLINELLKNVPERASIKLISCAYILYEVCVFTRLYISAIKRMCRTNRWQQCF